MYRGRRRDAEGPQPQLLLEGENNNSTNVINFNNKIKVNSKSTI